MMRRAGQSGYLLAPIAIVTAVLLAITLVGGRAQLIAAQDDEDHVHPAHIHEGTCDSLDPNPAYPLSNVGPDMLEDGTPTVGEEMVGAASAIPIETSVTTVDVTLDDLLAEEYAINVHESPENAENYIACGDIGGMMMGDNLVIGLAELNDSNSVGVAMLEPDGDQTIVTLFLTDQEADADDDGTDDNGDDDSDDGGYDDGGGTETPPAAAVDDSAAMTVEIVDFAFGPNTLEIPAGTTVIWSHMDTAPHTATADDGSFDSGRMENGGTFSQTFDTPGTYTYFCELHPRMMGTIVVT